MTNSILQLVAYLVILVALAVPLGGYIGKVMNGERNLLSRVCVPCERLIYRLLHIDPQEQMNWKKYALCVLLFSGVGFLILFLLLLLQGVLPLNPEHLPGNSWDLAFNTAVSFLTNTNWQAYSGESCLSYLSQMMGLTVHNFVSAAAGIAVLFALICGFIKAKEKGLGNFWADITRIILYIMIPISLVISVALVSQGVPQIFKAYQTVDLWSPSLSRMVPSLPSRWFLLARPRAKSPLNRTALTARSTLCTIAIHPWAVWYRCC